MKETVIQFGAGNFLRGFADYFLEILNEKGLYDGKAVVLQSHTKGTGEALKEQNCVYNLFLRGIENKKEICRRTEIHSISRTLNPEKDFSAFLELAHNSDFRFVISNTTEAGIVYEPCTFGSDAPKTFPAKLARLLFERYNAGLGGFIILACELIDNNGTALFECVLRHAKDWNLPEDFCLWLKNENKFCNTLVDRIVTGFPKDEAEELFKEIGTRDMLLNTAEIYHLWVIEGNFENELPLKKAGFNVVWADDVAPYKKRKVRVLNGAHTSMVFPAMLCGTETVGECLKDDVINSYLQKCLFGCILPVLGETKENLDFANAVLERFANPYIHHLLKSISLNSISKFSVRVLPSAIDYREKFGQYPMPLMLSLAALIQYYKTQNPSDDAKKIEFIKNSAVEDILKNESLWGADLSDMLPEVNQCLRTINDSGMKEAIKWIIS